MTTQTIKTSLVWLQVCSDTEGEDLEREANLSDPTGISSGWTLPDEEALDGTPQGVDCAEKPGFKHYLLHC